MKDWIRITKLDGKSAGEYTVFRDTITVRFRGHTKDVRSSGVPPEFAGGANESLARLVLGELVREFGAE